MILLAYVQSAFAASNDAYGSPQMMRELQDNGLAVGRRPVERIIKTAQTIRSSTLHERIEFAGLPAELQSLAATFNEMLDRPEESFAQVSQFSADVAHELRTPVNNLRGEIEVALGKGRSLEEYRDDWAPLWRNAPESAE
jgi:signal transduction histidine kinase